MPQYGAISFYEPVINEMNAKSQFFRLAKKVRLGSLIIREPGGGEQRFGGSDQPLSARMIIHDDGFFNRIAHAGSVGLGESYVAGLWDVEGDRLVDLFGVFFLNHLDNERLGGWRMQLASALRRMLDAPRFISASKRCIARHYDLSNDFFSLMLDPSMTYSCGYQLCSSDSLYQMQQQKYALVCDKLDISKGHRILDVGCGWGGMLIYAAKQHGASGVGITLSKQQMNYCRKLVAAEGLEKRIKIHLCDYRQIEGLFDRIVSIGMFEHVGLASYGRYMQMLKRCLKPGGRGLLHTIGTTDHPKRKPDPWIAKYIFPGSRLPRMHEIVSKMDEEDFTVAHIENLKLHYAETLDRWRANFNSNWPAIKGISPTHDDRFKRMWSYYLQVCEAGFRYGSMQLYQLLFGSGRSWSFPMNLQFSAQPEQDADREHIPLSEAV